MPSIDISGLGFAYGTQPVLNGIDLHIRSGDLVSLLGPSGCGKSTLLRLLAGLALPSSGSIAIDGRPVTGPGLDRGVVFQDYSLFPWMTVGENIVLAVRQRSPDLPRSEAVALAHDYLGQVNLPDAFGKWPRQLSGGMRQRVAIARVLAIGSPILLLDEPFGALDPVNRLRLQDLLQDLLVSATPRRTAVFVTHDVEEAILLGDQVVVLGAASGSVVAQLPVPFPRPRQRAAVVASPAFTDLRNAVFEAYHQDLRASLDAGAVVASSGEGI